MVRVSHSLHNMSVFSAFPADDGRMRIPPKLVPLRTPRMEPVIPPAGPLDELYWAVVMDWGSDWSNDEVIQKRVQRLLQEQWNSFQRFAIADQGEPSIDCYADFAARRSRGALQVSHRKSHCQVSSVSSVCLVSQSSLPRKDGNYRENMKCDGRNISFGNFEVS